MGTLCIGLWGVVINVGEYFIYGKRGKRHTIPSWILWKLTRKVIDKSGKTFVYFWINFNTNPLNLVRYPLFSTKIGPHGHQNYHTWPWQVSTGQWPPFGFWSHDIRIPIFVYSTIYAFINLVIRLITNLRHMWSIVWTVWLTILKLLYAKNKFLYWLFFWGIQINC